MEKRVFLIVLDSFGIGAEPDADKFGDAGSNTLAAISKSKEFNTPNLQKLGLFNIDGVNVGAKCDTPLADYARLREVSNGKDTTIGHWELAGIVSETALPTYPNGFPDDIIRAFEKATGRGVLCNKPYSGTDVIRDYGEQHMKTGDLIVYTSADSVFQVAANEAIVPVKQLYEYCEAARKILTGKNAVGRVIARPFIGTNKDNFKRTSNRHDISLEPPADTMLNLISNAGLDVVAVGKISDIFCGSGITQKIKTSNNDEGIAETLRLAEAHFNGLAFINLVDFDMLYGHRNDIDGYAKAMSQFDFSLTNLLPLLTENDMLIITADHGCDPSTPSTDHSREYVPMLIYGKALRQGVNLGTKNGFGCVAKTVCDFLAVNADELSGESVFKDISL